MAAKKIIYIHPSTYGQTVRQSQLYGTFANKKGFMTLRLKGISKRWLMVNLPLQTMINYITLISD